ncbi:MULTISPECIES: UDP-N-acetylmuramate dehydrogenase [unclassified Vibrio]|uniref:UDP-N-acetylenolpyruvoylglucosamine reductase n=1 Tax=Vibrio sp. HB236076 TaxID=3232307 RepID=A0AB39HAI1_9VIBR|nr:UDP-N-acetylmuramate dehydrogenase [Vibrio sp. HB161653]MDP5255834.1 UDP-N-acetylmuramate dehydrogenase [Vibrio sp. HB161653]
MQIQSNVSLTAYHTFGLPVSCRYLVEVTSVEEIQSVYLSPEFRDLPKLVIGRGSNLLFTEDFAGVVIVNRITGIEVESQVQGYSLHVGAGEDWPSFVAWTLEQDMPGLENLAMIPGCVGSAPIQNIGAYGRELNDFCHYVDVYDLDAQCVRRLTAKACQFGYRDSIFKRELLGKVVIVAVGLFLPKPWQAELGYGPLQGLNAETTTAQDVFSAVCETRQQKLPDPQQIGNAGSFFKNPVVALEQWQLLQQTHPGIVGYPVSDGVKLAAGWLIDQCGLKGQCCGGAKVHEHQALVLINANQATPQDVLGLAAKVVEAVRQRFNVVLEHEVRFMAAQGETNLTTCLEERS